MSPLPLLQSFNWQMFLEENTDRKNVEENGPNKEKENLLYF